MEKLESRDPPPPVAVTDPTEVVAKGPKVRFQSCRLALIRGLGDVIEFPIEEGETVVGSSDECAISVRDKTVSRTHFSIHHQEQSYLLRDLGSTNGTFVDDLSVKEVYVRPGAVIRAGDALFRFELAYQASELPPSRGESFGRLLGKSEAMRRIFAVLEKIAPTNATVLLQGETGTGKGAVSLAIHEASKRAGGPFVVFDCAAVAPNLLESELFGHERGAFTGATNKRSGALEEARGGTLFIDELSELSLALQPKLLRALEEREFSRVGSNAQIRLDCRVIAATQRDLWCDVQANRFRKDLYYRVAVVTIPLPPLKHRREDLPLLVERFLGEMDEEGPRRFEDLDDELKGQLADYDWPGNARELRNVVERACLIGTPAAFGAKELNGSAAAPAGAYAEELFELPFKEARETLLAGFEIEYIRRLLEQTNNNVSEAARRAGIGRRHIYTLMAKHGKVEPEENE